MQDDAAMNRDELGEDLEGTADDEYQAWKKNAPLLYDTLVSHLLEWPSLTCQFLPGIEESADSHFSCQRLLIGTNAGEGEQNYVMIMKCRLPNTKAEGHSGQSPFSHNKNSEGAPRLGFNCIELEKRFAHTSEINKARFAYGAPNLIATKGANGLVNIFDSNESAQRIKEADSSAQLILVGHNVQGFALDWKPSKELHVISGDNDGVICFWDIEKSLPESTNVNNDVQEPISVSSAPKPQKVPFLRKYENNGKAVNDLKFHRLNTNYFACASEDSTVSLWDLRTTTNNPFIQLLAHNTEVFSLDFSHYDEFLFLTGAADGIIKLWDMRKMVKPIHEFESHSDKVLRVEWNPNNESLFASSSEDKTVNIWDCSRIGDDVVSEDHPDGPSELLFKHKGHKGRVEDICWNPQKELGILSTDSTNLLQAWEIDEGIYYDEL